MSKQEYVSLEGLEDLQYKDVEIEGNLFRIRALPLVDVFGLRNLEQTVEDEDYETVLEVMQEKVCDGLVEPAVDESSVEKLGRFVQPLFSEILDFSMGGIGEKNEQV